MSDTPKAEHSVLPKGLRWLGPLLAEVYGAGVALHRAASVKRWAPLATICVGNLTAGGTGKTPAVIYLARELARRGRKPAILMRGYKAQGGDEAQEAASALRDQDCAVPIILGADRLRGAQEAAAQGCDVVLLDDGFQHWRLQRDLDIVLLDSTSPLGGGALLPQGRLREPPTALRRAGIIVLTRAPDHDPDSKLLALIQSYAPHTPVLSARHRPVSLRPLTASSEPWPLSRLKGLPVVAACGIGNPAAFVSTLEECGATVVNALTYPDHHAFSASDVRMLLSTAQQSAAAAIIGTEKDAVKLEQLKLPQNLSIVALKVEFQISDAGELWREVSAALERGDQRRQNSSRH